MEIDPATILLGREGIAEGVSPLRYNYEDVATPFEGEPGEGHDLCGDGLMDLAMKFQTQELVEMLALLDVAGETIPLTLSGSLMDGTLFEGGDYVRVMFPGKGDGNVNMADFYTVGENGTGTLAAVPEPATLSLLILGGLALLRRKRGYGA